MSISRPGGGRARGLATDPFLAVDLPNARPRARPFAGTYLDFVKATTLSAKLNAPSLVPYFLYVYLPDQEFGEEDDLTRWLTRMGTRECAVLSGASADHLSDVDVDVYMFSGGP